MEADDVSRRAFLLSCIHGALKTIVTSAAADEMMASQKLLSKNNESRVISKIYYSLRDELGIAHLVNDISSPSVYRACNYEQLEDFFVETLRAEMRGRVDSIEYSVSYTRPVLRFTQDGGEESYSCCEVPTCAFRGSLRGLVWHYNREHGCSWVESKMKVMKLESDSIVLHGKLKAGGAVTSRKAAPDGPLMDALKSCDLPRFKELYPPGAFNRETTDSYGCTILHHASRFASDGILPIVTYLVDTCGHDVNEPQRKKRKGGRGFQGRTLVHWAFRNRNLPLLQLLSRERDRWRVQFERPTEDGTIPICFGVYSGWVEGVKLYNDTICPSGFEWYNVCNKYGCNAVLWSGMADSSSGMIEYLYELLPKRDIWACKNENDLTVVHKLAQNGNLESIKYICAKDEGLIWGRDLEGHLASELAGIEGKEETKRWLQKEEERRGIFIVAAAADG